MVEYARGARLLWRTSQRHRLEPFAPQPKKHCLPAFRASLMARATSKTDTAHGSNPARHTEMQVQTFSARRGFRPPMVCVKLPKSDLVVFHLCRATKLPSFFQG